MTYYYLNDMKRVGKVENYVPYLYNSKKKSWEVDNDNILMDRLMGYDSESIGNSSMLFLVEEISEAKANELMSAH